MIQGLFTRAVNRLRKPYLGSAYEYQHTQNIKTLTQE